MKPKSEVLQSREKRLRGNYPPQFWVLFWGLLISSGGVSMVWPFLTIYLREHLSLPMTDVTLLLSLESIMTMIATLTVGPIMDRFGRKWVMVISLAFNAISFFLMGQAVFFWQFVILMSLRGLLAPLFRVGSNTMVADLIPEDQRVGAYSLVRTASNVGFAVGPAFGGIVAAASFALSLNIGAVFLAVMTILAFFLLKESLPQELSSREKSTSKLKGGYASILKDRFFAIFLVGDTLVKMAMVMMFVLLSVYVKENFGIPENKYGLIMTVNAVMAASLQYPVTSITRRFKPTRMLALGAVFYALGLGSVAFGSSFSHFVISMMILTVGELILMPVAVNLVSELAPADQRGRYMSLYSLTMGAAKGVGPVMGGLLNDHIAPVAIWYGGFVMGFLSSLAFLVLGRQRAQQKEPADA